MNSGLQPEKSGLAGENGSSGELTYKRNKTVDFIAKIGCLLIAFFIWYYAAGRNNSIIEEDFSSIPVEIMNESRFSVLSGDGVSVDVTVSGKTGTVMKLKKSEIRAYIDVSGVTEAGKYKFDIVYDVPNGITVKNATSNSLTVHMDNTTTVSVPVQCRIENYMVESGYELDKNGITFDVRQINVTGPESTVSKIASAVLYADIGHVTRTVICSGDVKLVDSAGNEIAGNSITKGASNVTATIPVYKYRDVPVDVTFRYGYMDHVNTDIRVSPATVRIKGDEAAVDAVRISYEIDEKKITDPKGTSYTVSIALPDGVQNISGETSAEISVEIKGLKTKNFAVYNISYINPKGLAYEPVRLPVNIKVRGESAKIDSNFEYSAVIDLSELDENSGSVTLPISFSFPEGIYEVGQYTVTVKIPETENGGQ